MRRRTPTVVERLQRHQVAIGAVILAVGVAAAAVAALSTNGVPFASGYRLQATLPAGAPHVIVGAPVRIAGVYAGTVTDVDPARGGRQRIGLRLRVSPVGRRAQLVLRPTSAAGGSYVSLTRGDFRRAPLPSGATIPATQVAFTEDLATLVAGFSRSSLSDLRRTVRLSGGGLADRGPALNRAFLGLGTTLAEGRRLLRAASPGTDLTALVRDGGTAAAALGGRRHDDAGRLVGAAANATSQLGAPAARLGALVDALPPFERSALATLPPARSLLVKTRRLARTLEPVAEDLDRALPSLTGALRSGPVLRTAVPPLARDALPALRALAPVLARVGPSAALLSRMLPSLGELTAYMSRFPREIELGSAAYYAVTKLHYNKGKGYGYPAVPLLLVLTCAPGYNPEPTPGSVIEERKPCRG